MNKNAERILDELDGFRMSGEMTYTAYSRLHDSISKLNDLLKEQENLLGIHQTADSITFISTGTAQQGEARGISLGNLAMHEWLEKELLYRGLFNDDIRAVFDLAQKNERDVKWDA